MAPPAADMLRYGAALQQLNLVLPQATDRLPPILLLSDAALFHYTQVYEAQIRASGYRQATIYHVLNLNHGQLWRDLAFNERSRHRAVLVDFILLN